MEIFTSEQAMNGQVIPHTPIAVDLWHIRQCVRARLFFLSHLHGDHTQGLTPSWSQPLYCSPITKKLLIHRLKVKAYLIQELEVGQSHIISLDESGDETMSVFLIDANHCPGAVMFLFQGYFGTILHTGDFRYCSNIFVDSPLEDPSIQTDVLYLDNTYCEEQHGCDFPPREEAVKMVVNIIESYPGFEVVVGMRSLGKEELLVILAQYFSTWIVVSPEQYSLMEVLEMPNVFTTEPDKGFIRVVPFHHVTAMSARKWNAQCPTIVILPTALYNGMPAGPFSDSENIFVVPYSDHSSNKELQEFVSLIRPKQIIPVVKGNARGVLGTSLKARADMSCFKAYIDRIPRKTFVVPPSVRKWMDSGIKSNTSCTSHRTLKRTHGEYNKRLPSTWKRSATKGVMFHSPEKSPGSVAIKCIPTSTTGSDYESYPAETASNKGQGTQPCSSCTGEQSQEQGARPRLLPSSPYIHAKKCLKLGESPTKSLIASDCQMQHMGSDLEEGSRQKATPGEPPISQLPSQTSVIQIIIMTDSPVKGSPTVSEEDKLSAVPILDDAPISPSCNHGNMVSCDERTLGSPSVSCIGREADPSADDVIKGSMDISPVSRSRDSSPLHPVCPAPCCGADDADQTDAQVAQEVCKATITKEDDNHNGVASTVGPVTAAVCVPDVVVISSDGESDSCEEEATWSGEMDSSTTLQQADSSLSDHLYSKQAESKSVLPSTMMMNDVPAGLGLDGCLKKQQHCPTLSGSSTIRQKGLEVCQDLTCGQVGIQGKKGRSDPHDPRLQQNGANIGEKCQTLGWNQSTIGQSSPPSQHGGVKVEDGSSAKPVCNHSVVSGSTSEQHAGTGTGAFPTLQHQPIPKHTKVIPARNKHDQSDIVIQTKHNSASLPERVMDHLDRTGDDDESLTSPRLSRYFKDGERPGCSRDMCNFRSRRKAKKKSTLSNSILKFFPRVSSILRPGVGSLSAAGSRQSNHKFSTASRQYKTALSVEDLRDASGAEPTGCLPDETWEFPTPETKTDSASEIVGDTEVVIVDSTGSCGVRSGVFRAGVDVNCEDYVLNELNPEDCLGNEVLYEDRVGSEMSHPDWAAQPSCCDEAKGSTMERSERKPPTKQLSLLSQMMQSPSLENVSLEDDYFKPLIQSFITDNASLVSPQISEATKKYSVKPLSNRTLCAKPKKSSQSLFHFNVIPLKIKRNVSPRNK